MIDTLKLANRLETAGFTPKQAQGQAAALGELMDEAGATKGDLELAKLELKSDLEVVKLGLQAEIERTRNELKVEIERAKNETVRWVASIVIGTSAVQAVILAMLLKYLK